MAGRPGFVLEINSQLVEIDSNRRLSRIVRNLASSNIIVTVMKHDGSDKIGISIPAMVTIVCSKKIYHMFGIG